MAEMTIIVALEKLAELNETGDETLVQTNTGEPTTIYNEIDNIKNFANDPDEVFDLRVTEDSIKEFDVNGYIKTGEAIYKVVREAGVR